MLAMSPLEGYQLEREGSHAVALELELDDELRREGLAREIVHAIQNARKSAGLQVEDRIHLGLGGDEELLAAAREHEDYVKRETLRGRRAPPYNGAGARSWTPVTIEGTVAPVSPCRSAAVKIWQARPRVVPRGAAPGTARASTFRPATVARPTDAGDMAAHRTRPADCRCRRSDRPRTRPPTATSVRPRGSRAGSSWRSCGARSR